LLWKRRLAALTTSLSFSDVPFPATTLSFVIPSEAEGSAVPRTLPGNVFRLPSIAKRTLERKPRYKLKLPHSSERTPEDIVYLTIPSAIDAGVAGIGQVGMVESVLCLHFQFHR
jgi:hypothetical protein